MRPILYYTCVLLGWNGLHFPCKDLSSWMDPSNLLNKHFRRNAKIVLWKRFAVLNIVLASRIVIHGYHVQLYDIQEDMIEIIAAEQFLMRIAILMLCGKPHLDFLL